MDYLLKSSALIVIFYVCYIIFLQRETFFTSNRYFLIFGLITTILFPLLVIPIYIEAIPITSTGFTIVSTTVQDVPETFDFSELLIWIYGIGVSFIIGKLIIQLLSLTVLIKNNKQIRTESFIYVETNQNTTPFSFFRWIVYNPKQFTEQELNLILQHEKIHARQMHSVDVLLMDLATALFWFNPIVWLYRKALKQNLEFIADRETQKRTACEKQYQKLLLKTSLPQQNHMLINTFYNSTLKKRIVMLHKSKSKLMNSWKYSIIAPLLVVFAMNFNTKIIAQTSGHSSNNIIEDQQNILKFVITKDTKDSQLDYIKDKLADNGATISFNKVQRNAKNEITNMKILFKYKNSSGNHVTKSSDPIKPIEISINPTGDAINVGQQESGLSQTFDVEPKEKGDTTYTKTVTAIIKKTDSVSTSKDENTFQIIGVKVNENGDKPAGFVTKDGKTPLVYFDGNEINMDEMNTIDPNSIESISVLKDKTATEKYGKKGEDGVILIISKKGEFTKTVDGETISIIEDSNQNTRKTSIVNNGKTPLYILDGKEITSEQMEAIQPSDIDTVTVLKDKSATDKYGKKGENGVIVISLKKE